MELNFFQTIQGLTKSKQKKWFTNLRSLLGKQGKKETFLQDLANIARKNKKFHLMKPKCQKGLKPFMKETLTSKEEGIKAHPIQRNSTLKRMNSHILIYTQNAARLELSCLTVSPRHLKSKNQSIIHSCQLVEVKIRLWKKAKHNTRLEIRSSHHLKSPTCVEARKATAKIQFKLSSKIKLRFRIIK